MKGREGKGASSADLLACFPSRAHLTLVPKSICSPARPSEPNKRHHHHKKAINNRGGGVQGSPLLWAKTKPMGVEISEPTSPKVTCAGQIKVRPSSKATSCKNWQSVMEEIEKLHNNRSKQRKRPNWVEALGFKKDIMQFLTCLRSIRFDFRCFGSFPTSDINSDDEEDDYHEDIQRSDGNETSRTFFSKWFKVLQENQNNGFTKEHSKTRERSFDAPCAPPSNALLLMRCRSAPAKSWLEQREEEEEEEEKKARIMVEEEKRKKKENLVVMRYDGDFYKFSSDIAKETWVVGGIRDPLSIRSQSWKR